jgi:hypothetical protein
MNTMIRTKSFALLLIIWSAATGAAPGELDLTFGTGGEVLRPYGYSTAVAQMPDGRLLMYDTNALSGGQVRLRTRMLTAGGQPVPGWGSGGAGVITLNFDPYLQATWTVGDFRLAGTSDGGAVGTLTLTNAGSNVSSANTVRLVRAIRLRSDGSHDAAYAAASPASLEDTRNGDWAAYLPPFVQADGGVLVAHGCSSCDEYLVPTGLQRLGADGSAMGFYSFNQAGTSPAYYSILDARSLPDNKVVVAGDAGAMRFNADGSLDTTYGILGVFRPDTDAFAAAVSAALGTHVDKGDLWISDAAIGNDGKVILTLGVDVYTTDYLVPSGKALLLRLDGSGRLDPGFGGAGNGIAQVDWSSSTWASPSAYPEGGGLAVAPNGRVVVIMRLPTGDANNDSLLAVWRLDASGRQLANAPLPGIQMLSPGYDSGIYVDVILAASDDGSIYLLTSRSLVRLSANAGSSPGLLLARDSFSIDEDSYGTGTLKIAVTRVAGSSGRVSVDYATGASAALRATSPVATAGTDYDAASGRLEWADGELGTKYIELKVHNDSAPETWERFEVTFSNVVGGLLLAADATTITIHASDQGVVPPAPTPTPTPDGSAYGGGGAMDLWLLLLLAASMLALLRRRRVLLQRDPARQGAGRIPTDLRLSPPVSRPHRSAA